MSVEAAGVDDPVPDRRRGAHPPARREAPGDLAGGRVDREDFPVSRTDEDAPGVDGRSREEEVPSPLEGKLLSEREPPTLPAGLRVDGVQVSVPALEDDVAGGERRGPIHRAARPEPPSLGAGFAVHRVEVSVSAAHEERARDPDRRRVDGSTGPKDPTRLRPARGERPREGTVLVRAAERHDLRRRARRTIRDGGRGPRRGSRQKEKGRKKGNRLVHAPFYALAERSARATRRLSSPGASRRTGGAPQPAAGRVV